MTFRGPLEDRLAIRERYDAYSDAVFRADTDSYLECWTFDGSRTGVGGECAGEAELRSHWEGMWRAIERMTFFTQVAAIDVDGDRAAARAHCLEIIRFRTGETQQVAGTYVDELAEHGGIWRFRRRHYEVQLTW